jgi:hypothetical protein
MGGMDTAGRVYGIVNGYKYYQNGDYACDSHMVSDGGPCMPISSLID